MRAYPMENKMPLIHHAIKQQGCCTVEEGAIMVTCTVPSVTSVDVKCYWKCNLIWC